MPKSFFKFKQFTIRQEGAAMKVGTDGVLLGAWIGLGGVSTALDIGTGSGVIALMIAQRCNAVVDAVEIDSDSANQAKSNFDSSPWKNRVTVYNMSFQNFYAVTKTKYDLIVSNPPYFSNSLKSAFQKRNIARHVDELPYHQLIEGVAKLLGNNGKFCAVFPYTEGNVFIAQAANAELFCTRKTNVYSHPHKPVLRLLLEFSFMKEKLVENELSIHNLEGNYSDDYKKLTKDFYLAF